MKDLDIDLPIFLDAISWGNERCTRDKYIQYQRVSLLQSEELPFILERWQNPPRSSHSMTRPAGATAVLNSKSLKFMTDTMNKELKKLGPKFHLKTSDDISPTELNKLGLNELSGLAKVGTPTLWSLLKGVLCDSNTNAVTSNNWERISLAIISMILYTQSHNFNRLQKLLAIYFKFCGVSAKGFDTLHALGITMSHKWTCDSVGRMSNHCMAEVVQKAKTHPWLISYDNINIPFRVFSQRLDNQGEFGNGTAATVYIKCDAPKLSEGVNTLLKDMRAAGRKSSLSELQILDLGTKSYPQIQEQMKYIVLQILLDTPRFDFKTYKDRKNPSLQPPNGIDRMPIGEDHITLQWILGTLDIAEASYEDNNRLVNEWLQQLGWTTAAEKQKLAMSKVVTWVGDQLTMDRLRHLYIFHGSDDNSYDRMDYSVLIFGWFHLQMAYANSLHKQYLGTSRGRGLQQAFDLLNRKGLNKVMTQGPFHHNLDEALHHIAQAHIREDWIQITGVQDVSELRTRTGDELMTLASKLVEDHASSEALDNLDTLEKITPGLMDEEFRQVIMWNRDILQYLVLDQAIKDGDVGFMESMLPHLLSRFVGGGNSKYAIEVLELMEGLYREWPEEIVNFVKHHCWLVNMTGKPGSFCPVDMAQEHNIRDIKVTYRSQGPNIKWKYLKWLHPAIHVIRSVTMFIEKEFKTLARGAKHTSPTAELDIKKLQDSYHAAQHHKYIPGREASDKAVDYSLKGEIKLHDGKTLGKWQHGRAFERALAEDWLESDSDDEMDTQE
ncbi:hypothetical protein BDQ17DRAFT_1256868 [Cyathus striatus]|nr:hypothetical protein BDQ17DRAFT_1256868 [Cyathus striatus]